MHIEKVVSISKLIATLHEKVTSATSTTAHIDRAIALLNRTSPVLNNGSDMDGDELIADLEALHRDMDLAAAKEEDLPRKRSMVGAVMAVGGLLAAYGGALAGKKEVALVGAVVMYIGAIVVALGNLKEKTAEA